MEAFPKEIEYLFLEGNPCSYLPDYRLGLISTLPNLKELDEKEMTVEELRLARKVTSEQDADEVIERDDERVDHSQDIYADTYISIMKRCKERQSKVMMESKKRMQELRAHLGLKD